MTTLLKRALSLLPLSFTTWVYTVLLRPAPLRWCADQLITAGMPKRFSITEGTLLLNRQDPAVSGMVALGAFEPFETELFRKTLRPGMTVVDIGANIGYYTLIAAHRVESKGKVFAFEPEPENVSFLRRTVALNHLQNTVIFSQAISDRQGTSRLYLTNHNRGTHSLVDNLNTKKFIDIRIDTLDHILGAEDAPQIDLLKMDIEGAEVLALAGMKETIKRSPNLIIITEFYPKAIRRLGKNPVAFLDDLVSLGFSLSSIDEDQKKLVPLHDHAQFVARVPGGERVRNIYATRTA